MKTGLLYIVLATAVLGCNNNSSHMPTKNGYDTTTNITNPGVGAAADDTTIVDKDTMR